MKQHYIFSLSVPVSVWATVVTAQHTRQDSVPLINDQRGVCDVKWCVQSRHCYSGNKHGKAWKTHQRHRQRLWKSLKSQQRAGQECLCKTKIHCVRGTCENVYEAEKKKNSVIYCRTHGSHCSRTVSFTAVFSQVCRIFHLEKLPHNVIKRDSRVMGDSRAAGAGWGCWEIPICLKSPNTVCVRLCVFMLSHLILVSACRHICTQRFCKLQKKCLSND